MATSGSILGNPVLRREDPGILAGATQYFDDLEIDGLLHVAFVRSTIAHATHRVRSTRATPRRCPASSRSTPPTTSTCPTMHGFMMLPPTMNRPPLARDKVRFVGDIVAMVVAETKAQAVDAAEAVIVDYDPLPAVVDIEAALADDAPVVSRGAGLERRQRDGHRPGRRRARRRRRRRHAAHRQPARRAGADGAGRHRRRARRARRAGSTLWVATQGPHGVRDELAMHARPRPAVDPRRATRRSAAASAPRQGMIVEHLLVGEGRARRSAGR